MASLRKFYGIPNHLQFNPFILSGYRPQLSTAGCIESLKYLHNETGNIYTHIIAVASSLLYIHKFIELYSSNYASLTIISLFLIVDYLLSFVTFGLSVIYHTFMCHHGGKDVYNTLLKLDVGGVWLLATFGILPMVYTTFYFYPTIQILIIVLYFAVSLAALAIIVTCNSRQHRAIALAVQYALRVFVLACRLSPIANGVADNTIYYVVLDVLNGFGVLVNVLHIPERWFPGGFDYFFNGHQLMHISTMVGLFIFKTGFILDIEWLILMNSQ